MFEDKYNITLNIDCPNPMMVDKLKSEIKEITNKYLGRKCDNYTVKELSQELEFLINNNMDYYGVLIKNTDFTERKLWSLKDILLMYEKYYPERYDVGKETYTNIEVNNILFELSICGVVTGYECVAVPFDLPSHNDKLFDRSIWVIVPIINIWG